MASVVTTGGRDQILEIVVRELSPLVGPAMAQASVNGLCTKLGLAASHVDAPQIEALLGAIEPGLNVFVGRAKARDAMAKIRRRVDEAKEGR
ncbi:MAG: hypothetical protein ACXVEE_13525 [Polyangiales bacterium]